MAPPGRTTLCTALLVGLVLASCASVKFDRRTQTSGTFRSSGIGLTIASIDIPKPAIDIARENASDANLANTEVVDMLIFPYLGPFDFLLDILSVRYARIRGTWGFQAGS